MMPELMALKLLVLVRRVLQTIPSIKIQIEKADTQTDITRMRLGLNQVQKCWVLQHTCSLE